MKKLLLIILLVSCFGQPQLYAQKQGQERIDSLRTALSKSGQDTNRVNALNGLSEYAGWRINQNDTCIDYAQKALSLAQRIDYKYGMGRAYNNMGNGQSQKLENKKALKSEFTALKIFKETGNKKWEGRMCTNIAITYQAMADYPNAIKYFKAAIQPATEANDQVVIAATYSGISNVNMQQGNFNNALKNNTISMDIYKKMGNKKEVSRLYQYYGYIYQKLGNNPQSLKNYISALKISESIGDKVGIANCNFKLGDTYFFQGNYQEALNSYRTSLKKFESLGIKIQMAGCYIGIGAIYSIQGNYPKALKNQTTALEISKSIKSKAQMVYCYGNIGQTYQLQGNYPKALKNFTAALNISESIGDKIAVAACYNSIGAVYIHLNKAREGRVWLQKGLALGKATETKGNIQEGYSGLAQADSALGNFKSSLENYKMYIVYRDSIYNKANTKKLTQITMQYQFDKKQLADSLKNVQVKKLAAEKLSKQKTYTAMGGGLAVLLLVFSGLIFRNNKKLDKEKKKSEDLLLNILPSEVADELKEKGNAEAKQFDEVTVLFTDFVNFTQTAENLNPKELVQELNECFTAFDEIMERNGLEKIKTVGDAYLAVCGLPTADSKHAHKVVQAALDIRNFIEDRKQHEKSFDIRIGIHSGSVVAGIVGVKKFAYDIWGDTVNTAARMEENSEAGKINISEITYQLVKADFDCAYRGEVEAKNKGKMNMYFVN